MTRLFWLLFVAGCSFLLVFPIYSGSPLRMFPSNLFFLGFLGGLLWFFYVAVRHEEKPLPYLIVLWFPYSFVWYYFTRIRSGEVQTTRPPVDRQPLGSILVLFVGYNVFSYAPALIIELWRGPESYVLVALYVFLVPFATLVSVGQLWMFYVVIRYEKKSIPYVLLALFPLTCIWYYFERFEKGKPQRIPLPVWKRASPVGIEGS